MKDNHKNLPNYLINIEGKHNFNLEKANEAIDFLIYIFNNERLYLLNVSSIIYHSKEMSFSEYIKQNKSKNLFSIAMTDIAEFFKIFTSREQFENVFYKYLIENNSISDLVKKQKIKKLLTGVKKYVNYLWDVDCAFIIDFHYEKGLKSSNKNKAELFHKTLKNDNLLFSSIPSYWVYINIKRIYDIIWDDYLLFIDKDTEEFMFFYSNKKNPKKQNEVEEMASNPKGTENKNPYPRIFNNVNAFHFFERLRDSICKEHRTILADYSFVFRQMYADKYIYEGVKESEFRNFLSKEYQIPYLEKLKTLDNCSPRKKIEIYNLLKN